MNPWLLLAGFVAWTGAVAYFAADWGRGKGLETCQAEREAAQAEKRELEEGHARAARQYEEDRQSDHDHINGLQSRLAALSRRSPSPCRLGAERLRLWNEGNAGRTALPGEPAGDVRDPVPAGAER